VTRRLRSMLVVEGGLSLVEMMVALTIFAIITVGIAPLLASSIRGTSITRSRTVAKNVATEAMERIRGLPFFQSVQGQTTPTRRDVLDLFFPDRNAGFNAAGLPANTFTTTCTSTPPPAGTRELVACPKNIPEGYSVRFVAAFVKPGATPPVPQTFTVEPPSQNYNWSLTSTENPPTELLRMSITVSWTYGGDPQSFSLSSLIGQRTVSAETISGTGKVAHAVQVLTSYRDSAGTDSSLVVVAGQSESAMATRAYAEADESTVAAHLVLTQSAVGEASAVTLADLAGASSFVGAPPNSYPAPAVPETPAQTVQYSYDGSTQTPVAYIDATVVEGPSPFSLGAQVVNELPTAAGRFRFSGGVPTNPSLWVDTQADRTLASPLKLDETGRIVSLDLFGGNRLSGQSSGAATSLTSARKVETKAAITTFGMLRIFPTAYITDPADAVITISDFVASLSCTSTANEATADATGTWSATLRYWKDPQNDGMPVGSGYVSVPLAGSTAAGTDPLEVLRTENPLVYDAVLDSEDVYLFNTADRRGYFTSMTSRPLVAAREANNGRVTSAELNGALQITTVPTSAANPQSSLSISVGALSCEAVDRRGL
jgi:prepilin-type N-terminal cleavage/methylation domain-containing protein